MRAVLCQKDQLFDTEGPGALKVGAGTSDGDFSAPRLPHLQPNSLGAAMYYG